MLFIFIQPLNLLLNNLLNKGGSSRLDLYNYAIEYYSDFDFIRLLFGNGIEFTRSDFEAAFEYGSVHCAYLQVLLYFGFCGLLWLVLFLLFSLVRYTKLRKNSHQWSCNFICILLWSACIMLTNTTIIFTSPIDCFFLTTFAVILPLYVSNAIKNGHFFSNSGK